ncbi:single-stranded DNA-binding protein [Eggerthella lenta]|uniref:single-stranded DNA-binding protein n=1 Tax=Eggerthella lenta TaxID=84112 RepID=UPI000DF6D33E|nr:single-stranded DNA-binding protein [Eggerthella lenta]RDB91912.1 single-stranded DNA-binding protein [Eggerthella lenta]
MSINRVCISGNLTRDPVLRSTGGGMSVLSLGVAVNDRRKNQQTGQWEDYPNFVDCTLFGTRGEKLAQYLAKGSKVAIEGKLRYRSWNDQQTGQKRSALEVVVDELEFMSGQQGYAPQQYTPQAVPQAPQARTYGQGRPAPAPAPQQPAYAPQPAPQQAYAPQQPAVDASAGVYDEDIPF